MKKHIQVGCAIILAFIYTNSIAQQIQNDTITAKEKLEDVSVTYNKWEQKLNEIPNRIVKLSLKNIRLQNPQTMADVLGLSGEVFIQKVN